MDYDSKKATYDAYFKEATDQANIIATAVSDALDGIPAEVRAKVQTEIQAKVRAKVRTEFIQKLTEAGFSTEDILKCDPSDFTIEEINRVKEE